MKKLAAITWPTIDRLRRTGTPRLCAAAMLVCGFAYAVHIGDQLRYADERDYWRLAGHLVSGSGYSLDGVTPTAYRPPGFVLFLAPFAAVSQSPWIARLAQFVVLATTMLVACVYASRNAGPEAARWVALLGTVYPLFFYTAGTLYPQTLASFLLLGFLLVRNTRAFGVLQCLMTGILGGFTVLTVPPLAGVLATITLWPSARRTTRERLAESVLILATVGMVAATWAARNYVVLDGYRGIATNGGINLLLGNNANASGDSGTNVDISRWSQVAAPLTEVERDAYYRSLAMDWIRGNTSAAARLYLEKLLHHFSVKDRLATVSESRSWQPVVLALFYFPLLTIAMVGGAVAILRNRRDDPVVVLLASYFVGAFLQAVFFTRLRFRVPLDWLLVISAALVLGRLIQGRLRPPEGSTSVAARGPA